jgi:hypothetical protein
MDRKTLESAAANYPYLHLQGLYAIPFGFLWFLIGVTNLQPRLHLWAFVGGALLCLGAAVGVAFYSERIYGRVTPTRSTKVRHYVAIAVGFAVFVAADQLARSILGRPPTQPVSTYAASWALGMLVFYAIAARLRAYHVAIWGSLLVAGLLPIWGGLSVNRDAVASFPIGVAMIASGLLDHRTVVRIFRSLERQPLESSDVGA